MAADVGYLMRVMNGRDSTEPSGKSTAPITRDLLVGWCTVDSKELDLDLQLQVPCGWEKRLDLKSGKVYLQRRESTDATAARGLSSTKFQDLNFPPSAAKPLTLNLFDDPTLDLKLLQSTAPSAVYCSSSSSSSSSVCTLDKVEFALERAERQTAGGGRGARKRSVSKSSSTSSSVRDGGDLDQEEKSTVASFAAGCTGCLLYVLVSRSNPRCPRCNCNIPVPMAAKKPRIDLNMLN